MIQDNLDRLIRDGIIKERTIEELGIPLWHWRETLYKNKSFHLMEAYKCTKKRDCLDFLGKDFYYFNQVSNADLYGKYVAARLSSLYKDKTVLDIFRVVVNDNIDDDYSKKVINIYKYFKIDNEVMKHFYRALYDALVGNEDGG